MTADYRRSLRSMLDAFDANRPPPMPPSALLYMPTWMTLVRYQAPWLVFPISRDAKRDARSCALWLNFAIIQYVATVRWHMLNVSPIHIGPGASPSPAG